MADLLDQLRRRCLRELRTRSGDVDTFRNDAKNASGEEVLIELFLEVFALRVVGDRDAVLDQAVMHVDDVERAVRADVEADRAETLVRGRDELPAVVRVLRREDAVLLLD